MRKISIVIFVHLSLAASVSAADSIQFNLRIRFVHAGLSTEDYEISADKLRVLHQKGGVTIKIFDRNLTQIEISKLNEFFNSISTDQLKNFYINPDVEDGYQVIYRLRLGANPQRIIRTSNVYQPIMISICNKVNSILPKEYRMYVPLRDEQHIIVMD